MVYCLVLLFNLIMIPLCQNIKKGKNIYFLLSAISLILLAGFRGLSVGTDTNAYYSIYNNIVFINDFTGLLEVREEIGYVLLNKFIFLIGGDYTLVLLVSITITIVGIYIFINNNTDNIYFAVFLFITLMIYFNAFNGIRQYIAIGIGINCVTEFKKNKYFKGLILILIAALFHKIAILYLLLAIINMFSKSKVGLFLFAISLIIGVVFSNQIVNLIATWLGYTGHLNIGTYNGKMYLVMGAVLLLFVFGAGFFNKSIFDKNLYFILIFLLTISLFIVANISMYYALRVAWLFMPIAIILIPNIIIELDSKVRLLFYEIIFVCGIAYFAYCLSINWQRIMPYVPFWA